MITDKNEILKKLGITLEQIFDLAPEWARWFAIDSTGEYYFFIKEPFTNLCLFSSKDKAMQAYHLTNGKPFDLTGIDWRACCWERQVDESKWIGCLGWFWDDLGAGYQARELGCINGPEYPYKCVKDFKWKHFQPLTIAELTEYLNRAKAAGIEE